jgi:hypothetical protein
MLLGILVACTAGCYPGVAWLPDSSGFLYQGPGGITHYDLKTGKARVLIQDGKNTTQLPAVTPDGKRIAVAVPSGQVARHR